MLVKEIVADWMALCLNSNERTYFWIFIERKSLRKILCRVFSPICVLNKRRCCYDCLWLHFSYEILYIHSSVVVVSSSQILIWIRFYCYQKFHHSIVRLFIHSSQSWAYVLSFEESNLAQIYAQKLIVTISYESNIFQKQKKIVW